VTLEPVNPIDIWVTWSASSEPSVDVASALQPTLNPRIVSVVNGV
jgi:hypothetical protein